MPPERWRNEAYLQFLRDEGHCRACLGYNPRSSPGVLYERGSGCEPAHGPVNGRSSKGPDAEAIPLSRAHHKEQHAIGWPAFESKYGFSREAEAKVWWMAFLIYQEHNA